MSPNSVPVPNIGETLANAHQRLKPVSPSAGLDAQVLLEFVLQQPRSWLLAHGEEPMTVQQSCQFEALLVRMEAGEPLPYLLGEWEFYGLKFYVTPDVLIPRPETELLVQQAVDWLEAHPGRLQAVDVGCGSGIIAISVAKYIANVSFSAIDNSKAALEVCGQNADCHGVSQRVHLMQNDLLEGLDSRFDLICANLPYIPSGRLPELAVYGKEPAQALDGGVDGLTLIRRLLRSAPDCVNPGGLLLLEIDAGHAQSAAAIAEAFFPESVIHIEKDLAGLPRLLRVEVSV